MKSRKIGIIGVGHVGAHVMSAVATLGIADEIVLVDINEQKAASEVQDLFDTVSMLPHRVRICAGEVEDLADADVVVNASGKVSLLIGNEDRTTELRYTIPAVHTWVDRLRTSGFDGIFINISNPCDVVTREIALGLGLPTGRVFGTGTGLDTARLVSRLAEITGLSHKSITAYMIGEHGNAQFCPWSCVNFAGVPLDVMAERDERFNFNRDEAEDLARQGGWVTFRGKNCTEYAVAMTAAQMAKAVLHDEKLVMPASALLEGEYGEKDIYVGVPCVIGADGVESVHELPVSDEELAHFHECCGSIRANMALADELFPEKQN